MTSFPTPGSTSPTPAARRSGRVVAVVLVALAALFALLLVRLAWQLGQDRVTASTISAAVPDDATAQVRFEINAPADRSVSCEARAQAADGLDVGSATTTIAPGPQSRREVVLSIPTRRRAVGAEVYSCRLIG